MYKCFRSVVFCTVIVLICWLFILISDRRQLSDGLIRFHVVAASDSSEDQSVKIKVRDAVLESIQNDLRNLSDISEAREYLQEKIPKIQSIVTKTLAENGFFCESSVTLCKESFPIRNYDTFSLPAGVYDSLRIVIGQGEGENWWCVAFPTLCVPASKIDFEEAAVGAGFPRRTAETLTGNEKYTIRFYFLEQLGHLENIFFSG